MNLLSDGYQVLVVAAVVPAGWQWIEGSRLTRLKRRLAGLERERWDRLAPAVGGPPDDGPPAGIDPRTRQTAAVMLGLAMLGEPEYLMLRSYKARTNRCR